MHRIDRQTLFHLICSVIVGSRLKRHKNTPIVHSLESTEGKEKLAELVCKQIDNDSYMVVRTEFLSSIQRHGKWDIDEPAPARVPELPKPPDFKN